MNPNFYRAFEDRHRGSRELILSRLQVYRPFIEPVKQLAEPPPRALDLGCGRGEWLELLGSLDLQAEGIDLDDGMLQACRALSLDARQGDAIDYLAKQPDESLGIVSAFHLVEHIAFEQLQMLVEHAFRTLVPGGLLIMETPNPENIQVGSHTFYLDPTHQRPLPPLLLTFLPEHTGFHRTKVLRLQEPAGMNANTSPSLWDVLAAASPDYAVVAQKAAVAHVLAPFDAAFAMEYGVAPSTLASRFEVERHRQSNELHTLVQQALSSSTETQALAQQALSNATQAQASAQQALSNATQAQVSAQHAADTAQHASSIAEQASASVRHMEAQFEQVWASLHEHQRIAQEARHRTNALLNSTSWRATAPLRWLSTALRALLSIPWRVVKAMFRRPVLAAMRYVLDRPMLRRRTSSWLKRVPGLAHHLHLLAIHRGLVPPAPEPPSTHAEPGSTEEPQPPSLPSESALSPHAQRIYAQLQRAATSQASKPTKNP